MTDKLHSKDEIMDIEKVSEDKTANNEPGLNENNEETENIQEDSNINAENIIVENISDSPFMPDENTENLLIDKKDAKIDIDTVEKDTVAFDSEPKDQPIIPDNPKKSKFKEWFGDKPVTRKFLAVALGITLLLNAGIFAGLMALFNNNNSIDMPQFDHNGRPGSEQNIGNHGKNGMNNMAPPGNTNQNGLENGPQNGDSSQNSQNPINNENSAQNSEKSASIGIVIRDDQGVYVADVNGEKAKAAGFETGDKIVTFDGTTISTSNDLISAVQKHSSGDTVSVTVERDGQQLELSTTLE